MQHALELVNQSRIKQIPDKNYIFSRDHCDQYRSTRFNESFHRKQIEENQRFPLAFNLLLHENVEQLERLLRLIYRPENFYCVHVSSDATSDVQRGIQSIIQCFDNVFLASQQEKVVYQTFSRLQADLNCMKDHLRYTSWKYLLNLVNSELPLKSNSELVKILQIYRGFNDIEGRWKTRNPLRTDYQWKLNMSSKLKKYDKHLSITSIRKKPPPGGIRIVKGSAYGVFSRGFVEFLFTNRIAREFLEWSRDTFSPDEHYWASLNYNVHLRAPGGYKAKRDPTPWIARFVNWGQVPCRGHYLRGICVFSTGDLPTLFDRKELFANKFQLKIDPVAYQCMEELILNRSRVNAGLNNVEFYEQMPFLHS